jgi:hypothetical protein
LVHIANPHSKEVQQDNILSLTGRRSLARLDLPVDKTTSMIEAD